MLARRTRCVLLVVAGALALLASSGCTANDGAVGPTSPTSTPPAGPPPLKWHYVQASGDSVNVQAEHGACDDGPKATVAETPSTVTITFRTHTRPGPCVSVGVLTNVTVKLAAPLGQRRLLGCGQTDPCRQEGS